MPALHCPRCKQPNPEMAVFCHHDGIELRAVQASTAVGKPIQEFVFPSGRRCRSLDELVQACQEDWTGSRDLLRNGSFLKYFSSVGRVDLARAAKECMEQGNADIGLRNLLASMPISKAQGPRLDLHPRRLVLGTMLAGETQQISVLITNQGEGVLQGTMSVAEGGEWLRINGSNNGQCNVRATRDQEVQLQVDTRGLAAGEPYGARLTVVTNGGVVELPARLDVAAHPFARPPFQGASTPREIAERMRAQPKAAGPLLESGEICRWFESNGWNYPVRGASAKGVAGVQQFFESMGLSKPPTVQLSQTDVFHTCKLRDITRGQVTLSTPAKKWVFARVDSDTEWLKVPNPSVSGPQTAQIGYEIDPTQLPDGKTSQAHLTVEANGSQTFTVRVLAQAEGRKKSSSGRFLQPLITCGVVFFLFRLLLVPIVDVYGRGPAAAAAMERVAPNVGADLRPPMDWGGWLILPWSQIYKGDQTEPLKAIVPQAQQVQVGAFRDYFTGGLLRLMIGFSWWMGAIAGVFILFRRGNLLDAPWGLVAGAAAGVVVGATLGCLVLVGDLVPHFLWDTLFVGKGGFWMLWLWALLVVVWWTFLGIALGTVLTFLGPIGRPLLYPFQALLSGTFRMVGLRRLGDCFAPG